MIIEGKIVNTGSIKYGQIEIEDEIIKRIGNHLGQPDLKTKGLIFPGFIDLHVHCREDVGHKQDYKEDFETASLAAIHGGVVAMADMPNNPVAPVDDESYRAKSELARRSYVDVLLYAGIGPQTAPLSFAVPYKVYMGKSVGEIFFASREELEQKLAEYQGQSVSFHCEDPEILARNENQPTHRQKRPREAEAEGIKFAIELVQKYKLKGKVCHLSTKEGLELIRNAKREWTQITAEVTPHHLYFDEQNLQMNPPLRTKEDRLSLLEGLRDGSIDYLASDHAPHSREEARKGISGLPHLDTYGAFASWLMAEHDFKAQEVARVCSNNPGKFVSDFTADRLGEIKEGFAGSLTILDLDEQTEVRKEDLKTKCGWSPFEGIIFPGRVTHTVVRGKIYEN